MRLDAPKKRELVSKKRAGSTGGARRNVCEGKFEQHHLAPDHHLLLPPWSQLHLIMSVRRLFPFKKHLINTQMQNPVTLDDDILSDVVPSNIVSRQARDIRSAFNNMLLTWIILLSPAKVLMGRVNLMK
jgi:hypothetical protein